MQGYKLIQADHISNVKRGKVCVYYKNHLHLKLLNINYLQECITFELSIKKNFSTKCDTRHEVSYLIHYDSLLQNATDILLQNASGFLLQNTMIL